MLKVHLIAKNSLRLLGGPFPLPVPPDPLLVPDFASSGWSGHSVAGLRQQSPAWPARPAGWSIRPPAFCFGQPATSPKKSTFIINLHTLQSEILNCIFHSEWIHRTTDTVISARMMHSHCNILHSHNLKLLMYSLDYLTSVNSCINKAFRMMYFCVNKYRPVTSKSSFSAKSLIFENSSKKKKLRVQYGKIRTQ